MADFLVEAVGLTVRLGARTVLDGIDLEIRPGEIVTVIGPNGAGKSTLVRALAGLVACAAGRVRRRPGLRIGYTPQGLALDPVLPLPVGHFLSLAGPLGRHDRRQALRRVGLGDVLSRPMIGLSGGELHRVLLARALLRRPDLLILDEPLSGVDVGSQLDLYDLIRRLRDETGAGVLLVSHDLHLVLAQTDRVICLDGHVCCAGRPVEIAADPAFLRLFGPRYGEVLAIYRHAHDPNHPSGHHHHHAPLEPAEPAA